MTLVAFIWERVRGQVIARINRVKAMMAMQKLPKKMALKRTRRFVMGSTRPLVQSQEMISSRSTAS